MKSSRHAPLDCLCPIADCNQTLKNAELETHIIQQHAGGGDIEESSARALAREANKTTLIKTISDIEESMEQGD